MLTSTVKYSYNHDLPELQLSTRFPLSYCLHVQMFPAFVHAHSEEPEAAWLQPHWKQGGASERHKYVRGGLSERGLTPRFCSTAAALFGQSWHWHLPFAHEQPVPLGPQALVK